MFTYYHLLFNTVEINSSFYHLPLESTFTGWYEKTSDAFLYAVKGSRYITHMKRLINDDDSVDRFLSRAKFLKEKLGPILLQLPPSFEEDLERLETFLKILPQEYRYTFEFRNHSWYSDDTMKLLKKYNCSFCIFELDHYQSPINITADFVYIRLHGPGKKYRGNYPVDVLKKWAALCKKWMKDGKDVFVYFDNDQKAYAAFNALSLIDLIND
jgi:uncharacterized protein YecE (DUF72 family)